MLQSDEREYTVRIVRHPLTDEQVEAFRAEGVLAQDFKDRSVLATDFKKVTAPSDPVAVRRALGRTSLTFQGERAELHECLGQAEFRPMGCEASHWSQRGQGDREAGGAMARKEPQTKPVPMDQWSVERPFDSAEYLGRRAAPDSSQQTPSEFKQDPTSDEDVEQVLAVFDGHGVQVNPNAPAFISDEDAARRWEVCVRLARGMTRQPALHPETRMAATSMFHSDIPTDDEGSPPDADNSR